MTLILGLECSEGLRLASDGQVTYTTTGQGTRGPIQKIFLQWNNVAWGGSGAVGLIQEAMAALHHEYGQTNRFDNKAKDAKKKIWEAVNKTLRPLLKDRYIEVPNEPPPHTSFLFVGWPPDGPFIMEIGKNLLQMDHLQAAAGYGAIGSGDIFPYFALASLAHFEVRKRTLREAKMIAYRVIQDAIKVAAWGLGPPIQMIEIVKPSKSDESGKGRALDDAELKQIEEQVVAWKELEKETLSSLIVMTATKE